MQQLKKVTFVAQDLKDRRFGQLEMQECNFTGADLRGAHFEDSQLLACNLTGINPLGAVFRLSCEQGSGNKLSSHSAYMFLYWMLHMFDLEPSLKEGIEALIGHQLPRIRILFKTTR